MLPDDEARQSDAREDAALAGLPINTHAPLPLTIPASSLTLVPPEKRRCYQREFDGSLSLRFVLADDDVTMAQHVDAIGRGRLPIFTPIDDADTPEKSRERGASAQLKMRQAAEAETARMRKDEDDRRHWRQTNDLAALDLRLRARGVAPAAIAAEVAAVKADHAYQDAVVEQERAPRALVGP